MAALVPIRHDPMGQLMCDLNHQDECQHAAQAERERIIQLLTDDNTWHHILYAIRNTDEPQTWYHADDCIGCSIIKLITGETNA
jgi:hypothetical protein